MPSGRKGEMEVCLQVSVTKCRLCRVWGLGFTGYMSAIMEHQMETNMENAMETGIIERFYWGGTIQDFAPESWMLLSSCRFNTELRAC